MKTPGVALILTASLLSASNPNPAHAGRGCGHRFGGRSARAIHPVAAPQPVIAYAQPAYSPAMPTTYAPPAAAQPAYAAAPSAVPVASGVAPTFAYNASPGGSPAYYYTYDKDDRLIPVQWMDWLFRGGRVAGEPAPPLPIIGRLQGR